MKLIIKEHRPALRILFVGVGIMTAAFAVAVALDYGHWRYIWDSMSATSHGRSLVEQNAQLEQENEDLKKQLTRQRRIAEIDERARRELQKHVENLQNDIAELAHELDFYRDILASIEVKSGPRVQGFQIRTAEGSGRYVYRLVLTHVNKDDKVAEGNVAIAFEGLLGGKPHKLALAELAEAGSLDMSFTFKHFRRFEGTFRIPDNFLPEQVNVDVRERGHKTAIFSRTYDWSRILN